ncbi:hypothetical protein [Ornithinimicrobium panacihumi]|uniref:hypothetical protein n=1 Tax=Ornithinimicrobium panacihumi TaxID=2008449 RepID=UPI003F8A36D8
MIRMRNRLAASVAALTVVTATALPALADDTSGTFYDSKCLSWAWPHMATEWFGGVSIKPPGRSYYLNTDYKASWRSVVNSGSQAGGAYAVTGTRLNYSKTFPFCGDGS